MRIFSQTEHWMKRFPLHEKLTQGTVILALETPNL